MFPMSFMIFMQMPNVLQKFFFSSLPLSFVIKKLLAFHSNYGE